MCKSELMFMLKQTWRGQKACYLHKARYNTHFKTDPVPALRKDHRESVQAAVTDRQTASFILLIVPSINE
jgi:hypothetical protein